MNEDTDPSGNPARRDEPKAWEWNDRERRKSFLDATPAERLAWLEEAIALADRAGALPRPTDGESPRT